MRKAIVIGTGKRFLELEFILKRKYSIIGISNTRDTTLDYLYGYQFIDFGQLATKEFDVVIICATSKKNVEEIYHSLLKVGILDEKIIKDTDKYYVKYKAIIKLRGLYEKTHYYRWNVLRVRNEEEMKNCILENYKRKEKTDVNRNYNYVINIYSGDIVAGGLADRLRGILSTYYICKKNKLKYKLLFDSPFDLSLFLKPNSYDWSISQDSIDYGISKNQIIVLDSTEDSLYQKKRQKKYLEEKINKTRKLSNMQIHVYTNAMFSYDLDYSQLFNELFCVSERLNKAIENQKRTIGGEYISVSFRFMNLFNDFNETTGTTRALDKEDAEILLQKSLLQIWKVHEKYPNEKILVNSDSTTFLENVQKLAFAYVVPGTVTHIDAKNNINNYEANEKTFLDFFMIANAKRVYLFKEKRMLKSGYPYAAALVSKKKLIYVEY